MRQSKNPCRRFWNTTGRIALEAKIKLARIVSMMPFRTGSFDLGTFLSFSKVQNDDMVLGTRFNIGERACQRARSILA